MSIRHALLSLRISPLRHGLAVGAFVAAAGGLLLLSPPRRGQPLAVAVATAQATQDEHLASFRGPGLRGTLGLSHRAVLATGEQRVFAEIKVTADQRDAAQERAPVSLVVALDTSGSMLGAKIQQAREAAIKLLREMRDDDQIAFLTYSDTARVLQPLARVGDVREGLIKQVQALEATGGTNIAVALSEALRSLAEADGKRARRIVLVSDGQDTGQAKAEQVAKQATGRGVVVSSLGVGLDFDAKYMAAVAQQGRGNFAFLEDGDKLAGFLRKELHESAGTVASEARLVLRLPAGFRLGSVAGTAAGRGAHEGEITLPLGSLFAGEERRTVVELVGHAEPGQRSAIEGSATWRDVRTGAATHTAWGALAFVGTDSAEAVAHGVDGAVLAGSTSVLASVRQLEAADAYARGDALHAQQLIDQNMNDLQAARQQAPAELGASLGNQARSYDETRKLFQQAQPASEQGRAAVRRSYDLDNRNFRAVGYLAMARLLALLLAACAALACAALAPSLPSPLAYALPPLLGAALALAASGSLDPLAVAAGALGGLAAAALWPSQPALAAAALGLCAYAERSARVEGPRARWLHLLLACAAGAGAGLLLAGHGACESTGAVALGLGGMLLLAPRLVAADDPVAHLLALAAPEAGPSLAEPLRRAASLRRWSQRPICPQPTDRVARAGWRSLAALVRQRCTLPRLAPDGQPGGYRDADDERDPDQRLARSLDERIRDEIEALHRAYKLG